MFELANIVAPFTPLFAVAAAIAVFLKRHEKADGSGGRSLGLFALGFFGLGMLSFILGFWVVNDVSCKGAQYAECTLGGLLIGGPLAFTAATGLYVYFWGRKGKRPNHALKSGPPSAAAQREG